MGNTPEFALLASDGQTWSPEARRGRPFALVFHPGAFTAAGRTLLTGAPTGDHVLVIGPDAVPAQRAWLKKLGRAEACAQDGGALAAALGVTSGGVVWFDAAGLRVEGPVVEAAAEAPVVAVVAEPAAAVVAEAPAAAVVAEAPAAPVVVPALVEAVVDGTAEAPDAASPVGPPAAAPVVGHPSEVPPPPPLARPSTVARPSPASRGPAGTPAPPPAAPTRSALRDSALVGLGLFVGAGVTWIAMRPPGPPPPPPKPAAAPVADVPAGPAGALDAPDPGALRVTTEDLSILNLSLTEDGGGLTGFGDTVAGNGVPDGWRVNVKKGKVGFDTAAPRDGQQWVEVRYEQATNANLLSRGVPAKEGDTFVLTSALDTGEGNPLHPAAFGIAFFRGQEFLDWALHRVENEFPGAQKIEIRATAPAGTDTMRVRWHFMDDGKKPAGAFSFAVPVVKRLNAESRTATFPLQHIFLLTVETWRADHTSNRGYSRDTTPNLVRIAGEGAWLDHHYVQAPYTRPSLSSLVTSLAPASLGVRDNVDFLPDTITTVAERFAAGGYVTGAFLAQYVLSQHYGFNQGFHYFYNYKNDTPGEEVWGAFQPWWTTHQPDNTFTWVHLFDPHGPYHPTPERRALFEGDAVWQADTQKLRPGQGSATGKFIPAYVYDEGEDERRHYVAGYDAEIRGIDEQLGAFVDGLRKSGLAEKSLVIITADHGESMTDHNRWFCHGNLYEHDLRVPMVVWAPGRVRPGTVVSQRTAHLDIVPTLLDYAGVPLDDAVHGVSMRSLLEGGTTPTHPFTFAGVGKGEKEQLAIRGDSSLKIIVDHTGTPVEAYDLDRDPEERTNVVDGRRAEAEAMADAFEAWLATRVRGGPAPVQLGRELSKEERERLEALGYIE